MSSVRARLSALVARYERGVAVLAMVLLVALAFGVGLVGLELTAAVLRSADIAITPLRAVLLSLLFLQGVGLTLVGGLYLLGAGRRSLVRLSLPDVRGVIVVAAGFGLMFVGNIVTGLLVQATNVPLPQSGIIEAARADPNVLLVMLVASFFVVAPAEEFFFRGIVQGRLRTVMGPVGAIGIATAIFATVHFSGFSGSVLAIGATIARLALVAVVLGVAYEYTDNLLVPIGIHAVYNATLFALTYVAFRFAPELASGNTPTQVLQVVQHLV